MHKYIAQLIALLTLALAAIGAPAAEPPLILISIDGFRPDYLSRGVTPNLNRLAAAGARAVAMRPSFPSITYPNHYTLVTGMRPDHHGLVDNVMSDAAIPGAQFKLGTDAIADRRWWDQAEPAWVTAERSGIRSAVLFWPGAEAAIHGVRPTISPHYDGTMPAMQRADTLLSWLEQPQQHMQCWRKAEIPARLAYGGNARVPGFFCLADPGWFIAFSDSAAAKVKGGKHGYDNAAPDMAAVFITAGPAFKPGVVLPVFDNVDVYPLLMRLLGVAPLPSDGDITPLLPAL